MESLLRRGISPCPVWWSGAIWIILCRAVATTRTLIAIPGANNMEVLHNVGHSPMIEAPLALAFQRLIDFISEDFAGFVGRARECRAAMSAKRLPPMGFGAVHWMSVLALALLALTALGSSATFARHASASDNTAKTEFELDAQDPYRFEVLCGSDVLLISWKTAGETNVDVFKVHRQALDDPEVAGWVNAVPLVAKVTTAATLSLTSA